MSLLIKGIEKPEHCGYCRFRYDGICHALQKTQYSMEECPLVPIPPHGDLIDRYDLKNKEITIDYDEWDDTFDDGVLFVTNLIDNAPVVIPAEKGENKE